MSRLFGTDGVRGIANEELTPDLAFRLGYAAALVLSEDRAQKKRVMVGMDTRASGDLLEAALVAGLCSAGADALLVGVVPTPGIAYLCRKHGCDAGAVISASHNPYEFNGIKFFSRKGYKLPDDVEDRIEEEVRNYREDTIRPVGKQVGRRILMPEAADEYLEHLLKEQGLDLSGMRIGMDCANGASYRIAPRLFERLGAEVICIGNSPDGFNINEGCGSTHLEPLMDLVKREGCDLGLAFDGDADRLMAVDDEGDELNGDVMLSILACDMKAHGELNDHALVGTVMSNMGMEIMARENGITFVKTKVGDRYVLEEMLKHNYSLGGEQSGHLIFLKDSTTGDGMLSALKLLQSVKRSGKKLSELRRVMQIFPQVLINATVPNDEKKHAMEDPDVLEAARRIEEKLGDRGRLLLRPSGTEPFIRVMLEGEDQKEIQELAEGLVKLINSRFAY